MKNVMLEYIISTCPSMTYVIAFINSVVCGDKFKNLWKSWLSRKFPNTVTSLNKVL